MTDDFYVAPDGHVADAFRPDGVSREIAMHAVGPGWRPLVERLYDALEVLPEAERGRITQVKEKFGILSIYTEPHDLLAELRSQLADASARKCQRCGAFAGRDREKLRYVPLCEEHYAEFFGKPALAGWRRRRRRMALRSRDQASADILGTGPEEGGTEFHIVDFSAGTHNVMRVPKDLPPDAVEPMTVARILRERSELLADLRAIVDAHRVAATAAGRARDPHALTRLADAIDAAARTAERIEGEDEATRDAELAGGGLAEVLRGPAGAPPVDPDAAWRRAHTLALYIAATRPDLDPAALGLDYADRDEIEFLRAEILRRLGDG